MALPLDASRVISGNYGVVYDENGNWLTNVQALEATIEIQKEDILRAGTRWAAKKVTGLAGSGTLRGYLVTSTWIEKIAEVAKTNGKQFVTSISFMLADPEAYGDYKVTLTGVEFDNIPLANFEVGSIVEQELNFTFTGFQFINTFNETGTKDANGNPVATRAKIE